MTINFKPNGDGSAEIQVNSVTRLRVNTAGEVIVNASDNLGLLASRSLTTDGYQKLPGGLILQWGYYTGSLDDQTAIINFPIEFPNSNLNISVTVDGAQSSAALFLAVGAQKISKSQFRINGYGNGILTIGYHWFAIGY